MNLIDIKEDKGDLIDLGNDIDGGDLVDVGRPGTGYTGGGSSNGQNLMNFAQVPMGGGMGNQVYPQHIPQHHGLQAP